MTQSASLFPRGAPINDYAVERSFEGEPTIGLALSGGGTRAALYSIGVLLYLAQSNVSRQLVSVCSVSGSSLLSGVMLGSASSVVGGEIRSLTLAFAFLRRGLTNQRLVLQVFAILATVLAANATGSWILFRAWVPCCTFGFGVAGAVAGSIFLARGLILQRWIHWLLVYSTGADPDYGKLPEFPEIAIACTDINNGAAVYFSNVKGGSFHLRQDSLRSVITVAGSTHLRLSKVARCSASYPILQPAVSVRAEFPEPGMESGPKRSRKMRLIDGGVWNNLGTDWWKGAAPTGQRADLSRRPWISVVCDASAPVRPPRGPSLFRTIQCMHQNTVEPRIHEIEKRCGWLKLEDRIGSGVTLYDYEDAVVYRGISAGDVPVRLRKSPREWGWRDTPRVYWNMTGAFSNQALLPDGALDYARSARRRMSEWDDYLDNFDVEDLLRIAASVKTSFGAIDLAPAKAVTLLGLLNVMGGLFVLYDFPLLPADSVEYLVAQLR